MWLFSFLLLFSSSFFSFSSSFSFFCWMTIFDFLIKKSFCRRKSLLNILLEIYYYCCLVTANIECSRGRSILPKGKLAWEFSIDLKKKCYALTFLGPGNTVTCFKTQKVQKGTECRLPSLATCHLVPLPGGNWGVPVSCVFSQRCFMQIYAYPI